MHWTTLALVAVLSFGCAPTKPKQVPVVEIQKRIGTHSTNKVLSGALVQLKSPVLYDGSYCSIKYPMGDVPSSRGACADVVVRALRFAGKDLQVLIHDDLKSGAYSRVTTPDKNIDHRRVLNQEVSFRRNGLTLTNEVSRKTLGE